MAIADYQQLTQDQEVTPDGRPKDRLRAAVIQGYECGLHTSAECYEFFNNNELWTSKRADFWRVYYAGLLALGYLNAGGGK
jgi:hypothetical protein